MPARLREMVTPGTAGDAAELELELRERERERERASLRRVMRKMSAARLRLI